MVAAETETVVHGWENDLGIKGVLCVWGDEDISLRQVSLPSPLLLLSAIRHSLAAIDSPMVS